MIYEHNYNRETDAGIYAGPTPTQESKVNEDTTQENPAVSKLREAFDTARNAIIEGSELARQVEGLRKDTDSLVMELGSLKRDLEYTRSRNKELDEQVTEVRRQRDNAISEGLAHKDRADRAEQDDQAKVRLIENLNIDLRNAYDRLASAAKERDDAMVMALEYESKLKEATAKLTSIQAFFTPEVQAGPKPVPHYEVQPRDEVGKFQPFDEGKTYPHGSQGESSF